MFVTFEGIEGAGKTTHIQHAAQLVQAAGRRCVVTREPGGTAIGRKIRGILLDPDTAALEPCAELLLYMADRVQHVKRLIQPQLARGAVVLCDRYVDATVAYQGYARGLDMGLIQQLHALLLHNLKPQGTLLLDLDPAIGLARAWRQIDAGTRASLETRFEKEQLAFHAQVRAGYLALAEAEPQRFRVIDADRPEDQVRDDITYHLEQMLSACKA